MNKRSPEYVVPKPEILVVSESTRKSMQGNRSSDTKPEIKLRLALWQAGLRGYRKNSKKHPGKPDIVFGKAKLAIFVHGCFWHGCTKCKRKYRTPKTNPLYWTAKIELNRKRDARNTSELEKLGYRVIVAWECDLNAKPGSGVEDSAIGEEVKNGLEIVVEAIRSALVERR